MEIYAKLGTQAGGRYRVRGKRKLPAVGDTIYVRLTTDDPRTLWQCAIVRELVELYKSSPLYFLERL